jgi:ADP-heptose:LPS heptosyltransferase
MKMSSMRRADRWLGIPVCAVLTAMRKLAELRRRTAQEPPRRIVIVKLAEQGSTVLAYRALRNAVARFGRENVFFVAFAENRFILDAMGVIPVENVVAIPTSGLAAVIRGAVGAVRRLRLAGVDAAVDFEFFSRASAALCYLSGARMRVGFHAFGQEAAWRGDLMSHRLSYNPHLHTSDTFAVMVAALDADPAVLPAMDVIVSEDEVPLPQWRATTEDLRRVRALVFGGASRSEWPRIVLLNANCSDLVPLRRWPSERYLELARRLLDAYPDVRIAFTGAAAEAPQVSALVGALGSTRCLNLAGRTTFGELLSLYAVSEVLVTNDSGPAHFAMLIGPETPALYGARSPRNHIVWAGLPCSPCVNAYNDRLSGCRHNLCMQTISVEEVFRTVCRLLDGSKRTPMS